MTEPEGLQPPPSPVVVEHGAHELSASSDDDEHFSDAPCDFAESHMSPTIPKTRIEKVDATPSYGEVPGTEASALRREDAEPDEVVVTGDCNRNDTRHTSGAAIPLTVVEEASSNEPRTHSAEYEAKRAADAEPDIIVKPNSKQIDEREEDSADDFDDFEEGAQNDDFEDFAEDFQQTAPLTSNIHQPPSQALELPFSIPDFEALNADKIITSCQPQLNMIFPYDPPNTRAFETLPRDSSIFLTPRSASLWSQLVAPPPIAPPDWIRSCTRRLFLVSLGVPVDLDEILPASKQKKLVLPSLNIPTRSPRNSTDARSASRRRHGEKTSSTASDDIHGKRSTSKRRKGPPPPPELDVDAARYLCMTTDEALDGMTMDELKEHVSKLEALQGTAQSLLDYRQKQTDEKIDDREAFEGVIENLVKHARNSRK